MKIRKEKPARAGVNFTTKLLVCLFVFLFVFVQECLAIVFITGTEPATLIIAVFALCGLECGVMGWIKTTKEKNLAEREAEQAKREGEKQIEGDRHIDA